jgi:hypothetical protein
MGDGASIHSVRASEEAASLLTSSIKDPIQAEREQFAREREEMARARPLCTAHQAPPFRLSGYSIRHLPIQDGLAMFTVGSFR